MGIRYLNKYFREECKNSDAIKLVNMNQLNGKKIVVDISIYLHKFAAEGTLIENIYSMLSIFRHYNIIPLFVFDGKAPAEKKELLELRLAEKKAAEKEFKQLETNLKYNLNMDDEEKYEITNKMDVLKKKFVSISKNQIQDVKKLINLYGMTFCDAPGEADELCAMFANKGIVWGCLSEDMDMFLYGCPRVLRYLSLLNHSFVLYDTKKITNKLLMNQNELREVCVISGTDYNLNKTSTCDLYTTLKYFKKFKSQCKLEKLSFYDWLVKNTNYIIDDYEFFKKNCSMFESNDHVKQIENIENIENIKIMNKSVSFTEMRELLKKDGFIFMK
jgi:flap endonuclease-1